MSNNSSNYAEHLVLIGQTSYYQEHRKILEEMRPDGNFNSAEWNEASAEAIIRAVTAMIEENNTALLAKLECPQEKP